MTDRALREAERAFAAERTHEAEVALLVARLRAGSLTTARVWLAAWLGHAAAREALGAEAPPRTGRVALGPWVKRLDAAGRRSLVRAPLESFAPGHVRTLGRLPPRDRWIAALRAWCLDGTPLPAATVSLELDPRDPLGPLVRLARTDRGWVKFIEGLRAPWSRRSAQYALLDLPPPPPPPPGTPPARCSA